MNYYLHEISKSFYKILLHIQIPCVYSVMCVFSAAKPRARAAPPTADSVLFDDTSSGGAPVMNSQAYYTPGYNMAAPTNDMQGGAGVNNLFTDPMANAAMMYGSSLANQGKDMVNKEVRRSRIFLQRRWLLLMGCQPRNLL